jgi:hypothetical protein
MGNILFSVSIFEEHTDIIVKKSQDTSVKSEYNEQIALLKAKQAASTPEDRGTSEGRRVVPVKTGIDLAWTAIARLSTLPSHGSNRNKSGSKEFHGNCCYPATTG